MYWVILVAPVIAGMAPYKLHGGAQRVVIGFAAIALTLIIGFRYLVGCDWFTYLANIGALEYASPLDAMQIESDPGYGLLSWVCLHLNMGIYGVNLVCGAIVTWGLFTFCARQPIPWLTFVLAVPMLVVVVAMAFTRQAAAIGFLMLAFVAFEDRKLLKFLLFVALAATFHKTAVVLAPLVIFIDPKRVVTPILVGGAATVMMAMALLSAKIDGLTQTYIGNSIWSGEGGAAVYRLGLNLVAAVLFMVFLRRWRKKYQDTRLYFILAVASIVAFPFAFIEPVASDRISMYLLPFQAAVFGRLPDLLGQKKVAIHFVITAVLGSAALMYVWFTFAAHSYCWLPYQNILWH